MASAMVAFSDSASRAAASRAAFAAAMLSSTKRWRSRRIDSARAMLSARIWFSRARRMLSVFGAAGGATTGAGGGGGAGLLQAAAIETATVNVIAAKRR